MYICSNLPMFATYRNNNNSNNNKNNNNNNISFFKLTPLSVIQARIDRDEALLVLRKNAHSSPGVQLNFDIQQDTDARGLAYDYCSIMHYGPYAFSVTGQFTIITKDLVRKVSSRENS